MVNSPPLQINTLAGVVQESCTNVELVECRYKWVIKNVVYVTNELKSFVFAANQNEHNVKWQLSMDWQNNTNPRLFLNLVSGGDKSVCFSWKIFVEDCKKTFKHEQVSGCNLLTWAPGDSSCVTFPYTKQQLLSASNYVCKGNILSIVVHITMVNSIQQQTDMATPKTANGTPIEDLGKLLNDPKFSDVTIIVGDSKIPAHKNILALRSDVFAAMFEHELEEKKTNQIIISDIDFCVMREMLSYIYTGDTSKVSQMAEELLEAADKYALEGLKEACISELSSNLTIKTIVRTLISADLHSSDQLKRQAIDFINAHSSAIVKTDAFQDLAKNYPHIVLDIFERQQSSG